MLDIDCDRREHPRVSLTRPCKVYEPRARKYLAGATCNASSGGLLLRLDRRLELEEGDCLFVAVAGKRRQVLLRSAELLEVRVVRAFRAELGETAVAVRFSDPALETGLPVGRAA